MLNGKCNISEIEKISYGLSGVFISWKPEAGSWKLNILNFKLSDLITLLPLLATLSLSYSQTRNPDLATKKQRKNIAHFALYFAI